MEQIQKHDSGCWLWQRALDKYGYGVWSIDSVQYKAHRLSYVLHVGILDEELTIDHLCFVRSCVRPDHLEPKSRALNTSAAWVAGKLDDKKNDWLAGTCRNGHVLAEVGYAEYWRTSGYRARWVQRVCRQCQREAGRRSRAKRTRSDDLSG